MDARPPFSQDPISTDVAIIGAGPVGLFSVFACGLLGLSAQVVDVLSAAGGQCAALYPDKPIYDIPGFPSVSGGDLVTRLLDQASPFSPGYHFGGAAESLDSLDSGRFLVRTARGVVLDAGAVLLTSGGGLFAPNRPPLPDLALYEGRSVFYTVSDPQRFAGQRVVIAGGGDSALDWTIMLAGIAQKIYLVHRRDKFRAAPASLSQLDHLRESGRVEVVAPFQLDSLIGADGTLSTVRVRDFDGGVRDLPAEALLCFFGLLNSPGPLSSWGINLDEQGRVVTDPLTGATSRLGVFAAGDVAAYPHKLKLILTGFAEATQAAHAIHRHLRPGTELHFVHSTDRAIR